MKTAYSCKLFGAQQVFTGIDGCITVLHSVIGCNFGSLTFHAVNDMSKLRQTTSVLSDDDIIFGGEPSLRKTLKYVDEMFRPKVIAVVTGCVSDIIQDDIDAILSEFKGNARLIRQDAAGYCGSLEDGYEESLCTLMDLMKDPGPSKSGPPKVNIIGMAADDPYLKPDIKGIKALLGGQAELGCVLASCTLEKLEEAPEASLNIVLGRGTLLAQKMQERFGIPYEVIDYPYGLTGAQELWDCLTRHFGADFSAQREEFSQRTADGLAPIYSFVQSLYQLPVAVVGARGRYRGMKRFLSEELGMEVVCGSAREHIEDLDVFLDELRTTDAAVLFGSSFEQELSDDLNIPLVHFDYPVFRRICITDRPTVGAEGTLCLVENLFNEMMAYPWKKGGNYSRGDKR